MNFWIYVGCAAAAYLFGSVPTGYWMGRARGIDIRTVGSGNIGATNTFRALGRTMGALALFGDILKGLVAVHFLPWAADELMQRLGQPKLGYEQLVLLQILCSLAVIAGHNWTIFLKFKGGKGVATSAGAMLALAPLALLAAVVVFIIITWLSRIVSLGSILAAMTVAVFAWVWPGSGSLQPYPVALKIFVTVMSAAVIVKHRSNIGRLMKGTEARIGKKSVERKASEREKGIVK